VKSRGGRSGKRKSREYGRQVSEKGGWVKREEGVGRM